MVISVASPEIYSPESPNRIGLLVATRTAAPGCGVSLISLPDVIVKSVPLLPICSPPLSKKYKFLSKESIANTVSPAPFFIST